MFQFRRFPTYCYFIHSTLTRYCRAGFPHSDIHGSQDICSSPWLFAACRVLHRLLMPRHSPCALISLTFVAANFISFAPPQAAGLALSVARPLPTETASLGFGGSPVGGGDKNSCFAFSAFPCGGYHLPSGCCGCVGTTRRGVYFSRKNGFLRVGALRRRTRCSLLHTALFRRSCMGVVSLPSACASCR